MMASPSIIPNHISTNQTTHLIPSNSRPVHPSDIRASHPAASAFNRTDESIIGWRRGQVSPQANAI